MEELLITAALLPYIMNQQERKKQNKEEMEKRVIIAAAVVEVTLKPLLCDWQDVYDVPGNADVHAFDAYVHNWQFKDFLNSSSWWQATRTSFLDKQAPHSESFEWLCNCWPVLHLATCHWKLNIGPTVKVVHIALTCLHMVALWVLFKIISYEWVYSNK